MAITLVDVMRLKEEKYDKGVIETFMSEANFSQILPIETIGTTEVSARRRNSIPDIGFRRRGEAYPQLEAGTYDTITDAVFAMGGTIDIDKVDLRDKNLIENPITERTQEAVTAMAWKFNDLLINGDHAVNPDTPEGIKVRLASLPATQVFYANSSIAALDLTGGAVTNGTYFQFLDAVDDAIYALDGHTADVCLTNADWIRAYKSALRRLNLYKDVDVQEPKLIPSNQRRTGANWANKPVFTYGGVKFYDMGLKRDQITPVVGTETHGGVSTRPAYFLKIGKPYFHGIQEYAMEIDKLEKLDDRVTFRAVVDWPMGFRHIHPRFMSVLRGTKVS